MAFKLERFLHALMKNKKALDLVKSMKPVGLVQVLSKDLGLSPPSAARFALELIKKTEGMNNPGIEPNKMFPVPASIRKSGEPFLKFKDGEIDDSLDELEAPGGKTNITPRYVVKRFQFPADPAGRPEGWPYDAASKAGMEPRNKRRKRPLMSAKEPQKNIRYAFKNPLDLDLRMTQPGGDGAGGGGIHGRGVHSKDNNMGMGGNSWTTSGYPGWSKSLSDKEFDLPDDKKEATSNRPPNAGDSDDEPKFLKQPNTGVTYPVRIGFGGRSPPRLSPHGRTYGRK